jgi:hypothetical protein
MTKKIALLAANVRIRRDRPREITPEGFAEQSESEGEDVGEEAAEDGGGDCVN